MTPIRATGKPSPEGPRLETKSHADRLFVPDTLWQHRQPLDAWGETLVALPDSAWVRAADYPCQLKVRFNNANNETHDTTLMLHYLGLNHQVKVRLDSGWLHADYLVNGQPTPARGTYGRTYAGGYTTQQAVAFPWRARLDPAVAQYQFEAPQATATFRPRQWPHRVVHNLAQGADSVRYTLSNPYRIPVWFTLYQGKKRWHRGLVRGDTAFTLRTAGPLKTVAAVVDFRWGGETELLQDRFFRGKMENSVFFPHNLQVAVETPAQAQPGQKVEVAVQVRDYRGRPQPRTNLTVWAINQQFAERNVPAVPYLGRGRRSVMKPRHFSTETEEADRENLARPLDSAMLGQWGLAQNEYYKFRFPAGGLYEAYLPTVSGVAQVQPLVLDQGRPVDQYLVLLNGVPVYFMGADQQFNGCIAAPPGKHQLTIRTPGRAYVVDSIEVRPAQRLVLSLAAGTQHPRVRVLPRPARLTKAEIAFANTFMVKLIGDYYNGHTIWVRQGQRQYHLPNNRHRSYSYHRYPYWLVGPLLPQGGEVAVTVLKNGSLTDTVKAVRQGFAGAILLGKEKISRPLRDKAWPVLFGQYLTKKYANYWDLSASLANELLVPNPYAPVTAGKWRFANSNVYAEARAKAKTGPASLAVSVRDTLGHPRPPQGQVSRNPQEKAEALALCHLADSTLTVVSLNPELIAHNLPAGCYRAAIITNLDRIFVLDTVCLRPHGLTYRQFWRAQPDTLRGDDDLQQRLPFKTDWDRWLEKNQAKLQPSPRINLQVTANLASPYAIAGRVFSADDDAPLPGASVLIKGTAIGALTDADGYFTIRPNVTGPVTLVFSFVGFVSQEVEARNGDNLQIKLQSDVNSLEEIVVVGYGISKVTLTGSISTINSPLQGKVAGVTIRGASTIGPLTPAEVAKLAPSPASEAPSEATGEAPSPVALRRNFRDLAFWQPTLTTDAQGRARFQATLPDNLTSWRTYAIAMKRRHTGLGLADLRAFKPVAATLATPRFLVEGDSAQLVGKVLNYTDQPRRVRAGFQLNGQALAPADTLVKNFYLAHLPVVAGKLSEQDSVRATFATQQAELSDGEARAIPVVERGTYQTHGQF
jgi:alpha-2-macroglobulin